MLTVNMFASNKIILSILAGLAVLFVSGSVRAQQSSIAVATALGDVLGSEDFCNLQYDQNAIKKFIDENVKKDDMQFTSTLRMMTDGTKFQNKDMSQSAKTAHCEQIERVARSYGFIQ